MSVGVRSSQRFTLQSPSLSPEVRELAAEIGRRGGRMYLVGGGVRDHFMGLPVKDWDLEVFGLPADQLVKILRSRGSVNAVGKSFGVFKWTPRRAPSGAEIDVSIPRRDSKVGPGHKGIAVEGDPTMSPREAAQRRDLTINALMWDLSEDRLEDPWGGQEDLARQRLRAVDAKTFLEDPLRALRVVQFAARMGFEPDEELVELCRQAPLFELPAERVCGEWGKLLLKGKHLVLGFDVARRTAVLDRVFPEAAALRSEQTLESLAKRWRAELEPEGRQWALMLAAWLAADAGAIEPTLDRMGMHTVKGYPTRARVLSTVHTLSVPMSTDAELRWWSTRAELGLALVVRSAVQGFDPAPARQRAQELGVLESAPPPLLLGRHLKTLGVAPGPEMGRLLAAVFHKQLDGTVTTVEEALEVAKGLLSSGV
jgi:tRNA nucleotidyltransferase (CCA-adding enzyme)